MTIPDLGHCAGSGARPIEGTARDDASGRTAVCGACSGRFELRDDGSLSLHESAATEERETLAGTDQPSP